MSTNNYYPMNSAPVYQPQTDTYAGGLTPGVSTQPYSPTYDSYNAGTSVQQPIDQLQQAITSIQNQIMQIQAQIQALLAANNTVNSGYSYPQVQPQSYDYSPAPVNVQTPSYEPTSDTSVSTPPPPPPAVSSTTPPPAPAPGDWEGEAKAAAQRHGIDQDIFARQIKQESGFNPTAKSPAGAMGIAQIMPATAKGWNVDPMDPKAALDAAAKNMRVYLDKYNGDWAKALSAYNAGPGAVDKYNGVPPYSETQNYVKIILQR